MEKLQEALRKLKNDFIVGLNVEQFKEYSHFSPPEVSIELTSKTTISFSFWRLVEPNGTFSFFDHNQRYGLEKLIDAYSYLVDALKGKSLKMADIDFETGDIILSFENLKLQIFKLNGYENWAFRFPDGSEEYSNYVESKLS